MNNYSLTDKPVVDDNIPRLRSRESELVSIIENLRAIDDTQEWSSLKTNVFDGVLDNLERRLEAESKKLPLNAPEMYKLQGQILWAKKFSNLRALANSYALELTNVRLKLNPPTERDIGSRN